MGEVATSSIPTLTPNCGPHICYTALPRHVARIAARAVVMGVLCLVAGAFLAMLMLGTGWLNALPFLLIMAVIFGGIMFFATAVQYNLRRDHLRGGPDGVGAIVADLEARAGFFTLQQGSAFTWKEFIDRCADAGLPAPRTVADIAVQKRLEGVALTGDLLEPESILSSAAMGRGAALIMLGMYALMALVQIIDGRWLAAVAWIGFGIMFVASVPQVRDLFRNLFDYATVVAGTGWLRHKGRRIWTVNDAMMLVRTRNGSTPLYVTMIGERGELNLTFTDEKDPDFVKLWQRWNHPRPRPELVVE